MKNDQKLKVMTIVGTRPELIRLCCVIPKMDEYFDHIFVYTKQSYDYELSNIFFEELSLRKPDYFLDVKSETLGGQLANIIKQTESVFIKEKPDAVLILGDTNSSLAAINAKRLKIPIFHMEAGNRSFDWDVPEEVNRRIVDHISDYNICYTEHARRYLIAEGIDPQSIFVAGSPFAEVFSYFREKIDSSKILNDLKVSKDHYFLVSMHREENVDNKDHLAELFSSLDFLAKKYLLPIIVSLHPRTKKRLEDVKIKVNKLVKFLKPFGYFEYCKLQQNALCVLSDSGSIQEESAIQRFSAVQIRKSTERPEAFDTGSIVLVGFNKHAISNALKMVISLKGIKEEIVIHPNYQDTNISTKVVKLIMGLSSIRKYHQK